MLDALPASAECGPLRLSALSPEDADDLFVHLSDPEVTEFMDIEPFGERSQALEVIEWATGLRARGEGIRWVIRSADDATFVGTCGFNSITVERARRGEIAYDLSRAFWGKGLMGPIMEFLIETGTQDLGLRRLEAFVTPPNPRSVRVLERHGFVREGVLRDHAHWKGRYWDQWLFARVDRQ